MPPSADPNARLLLETLSRHHVRYVVIGGVAAIAQGYPLTTRDLNVTPARDHDNLESLAGALAEVGWDPRLLTQVGLQRFTTPYGDLGLVFEPAGTMGYDDLVDDAVEINLGNGLVVAMASLRDLIRMKEALGREKDLMALPALRRTLEVIRRRETEGS